MVPQGRSHEWLRDHGYTIRAAGLLVGP